MIWSNILIYFVIIPLLVLGGLAFSKSMKAIRTVVVTGATALMVLALMILAIDRDATALIITSFISVPMFFAKERWID